MTTELKEQILKEFRERFNKTHDAKWYSADRNHIVFIEAIEVFLSTVIDRIAEETMTPDGFKIVYISEYFFNTLDRELNKIARHSGYEVMDNKTSYIRDLPTQVEFRLFNKINSLSSREKKGNE